MGRSAHKIDPRHDAVNKNPAYAPIFFLTFNIDVTLPNVLDTPMLSSLQFPRGVRDSRADAAADDEPRTYGRQGGSVTANPK
jgi:hypothetical protein